ncbi:MAG: hypothetical protein EDX89_19110 [Acidobacteria bacterium]|nr:MAG: hypothetical protein EDX89_19110 [Acidobacteriota bacterium]MCE7958049.1 hypothetical protein [Acidobacteria bacterium ACB2]
MKRLTSILVLAAAALVARPALGWNQETHRAIALAALHISRAADARVPIEYRDAFLEATAEADPFDRTCLYHRGTRDHKEAAVQAEKMFVALYSPQANANLYMRSKILGQFVHYVADCAVPNALISGGQSSIVNFFGNRNFVLYRSPHPLPRPAGAPAPAVAASPSSAPPPGKSFRELLQIYGSEAQWAEDQEEGYSFTFRLAVNLVADALLLLPPREGKEKAPDAGPAVFVINRMDTGRGGKSYDMMMYSVEKYQGRSGRTYSVVTDIWILPGGGPAKSVPNLLAKKALQVVEWRKRQEGDVTKIRALLFNNQDECAVEMSVKGAKTGFAIPGSIPPNSLREVEISIPTAFLETEKVQVAGKTGPCSPSPGTIPASPRVVYANTANPPEFKERIADNPPPQ